MRWGKGVGGKDGREAGTRWEESGKQGREIKVKGRKAWALMVGFESWVSYHFRTWYGSDV